MARTMIWIKRIEAWGCSDCSWVFSPTGPPLGNTITEMMANFVVQRGKEFARHVCPAQAHLDPKPLQRPKQR